MSDKLVRLSVPIPKEVNDILAAFIPRGLKAEVIRSLIECLITSQINKEQYIVQDLLNGDCELRKRNN